MPRHLPILDHLRLASPCPADWDDMAGDERVRFCRHCERNVYNLSALPRAEAEALVRNREGRLCVRFYQRSDGTVLTADCPVAARRQRLRQRARIALAKIAAAAALLFGLFVGRARGDLSLKGDHKGKPAPQVLLGDVAIVSPPTPAHPAAHPKDKKPNRHAHDPQPMPLMGAMPPPRTK